MNPVLLLENKTEGKRRYLVDYLMYLPLAYNKLLVAVATVSTIVNKILKIIIILTYHCTFHDIGSTV